MNIPQYVPYIGDEEKEALCRCIDDQWITSGKRVAEFEERIAKLCDVKHAVSMSNGTVAIYAMLKACGVNPGDHVVVPDFTFIATASMVVMARAKPIFADIDPVSLCITPESIDKVIDDKTTAVMPVGIYGQCSRWDEIRDYCYKKNVMMIEDSAQDIGVYYKKKAVGTYGVAGIFSFYADKVISAAGEGGMVVTDSTEIYHKLLRQKFHGNTSMGKYLHDQLGWNFRMTDINASFGLAQLNKLGFIVKKKKENEAKFKSLLKDTPVRFMEIDMMCENVPFRNVIFVEEAKPLIEYLVTKGISARPVFYPLHRQPPFQTYADLPVTDKVSKEGLSLPSSVALTDKEISYVCSTIKDFYNHSH